MRESCSKRWFLRVSRVQLKPTKRQTTQDQTRLIRLSWTKTNPHKNNLRLLWTKKNRTKMCLLRTKKNPPLKTALLMRSTSKGPFSRTNPSIPTYCMCLVSCPLLFCLVFSCRVVSCRVVSCHGMACLVLFCPVLPCQVLSCVA